MEIQDEIRIFERTYLSIMHVSAAAHFARLSANNELDEKRIFLGPGRFSEDWLQENNSYVTASVLCTTAFLEATINELFSDAFDGEGEHISEINKSARRGLASSWQKIRSDRRIGTLEKYQLALKAANRQPLQEGVVPFQNARSVIDLRNALIHYIPVTRESEGDELAFFTRLEKALQGKFEPSPLYRNSSEPFFPSRCLSAGCAKWVITNALAFADTFFSTIGITATYDHVRPRLSV